MSTTYEPTIGLEIHVQLNTLSKLFCHCDNNSDQAEPNINTCPICMGHPGHLPVTNEKAIEKAAILGLALGCRINEKSAFDRKNYFYPDLPMGYQITQMYFPIAQEGVVEIWPEEDQEPRKIRINRAHIEADAGKLIHQNGKSYVDWNRCSTPLVEIVTEPDLRSAAEARAFFENIRAICRYTGVSDGDLEKGHLRCDANISLRSPDSEKLGTRAEIKNINSFRAVEAAINYEIERQTEILESGKKVIQETRGWDDAKKITVSQRSKEESHDYRYMPEPDLPPLRHDPKWVAKLKKNLPELPMQKRQRFIEEMKLNLHDARLLSLHPELSQFFEETNKICDDPKQVARWLLTEHFGRLSKAGLKLSDTKFTPAHLAELVKLIDSGDISGKIGKDVFDEMFETGVAPREIIEKHGWKQVSDTGALEKIITEVVKDNPDAVAKYKGGDNRVFGFFVGQVMKKTGGQANPGLVNEILKNKLS